jgi:hypothetical protein
MRKAAKEPRLEVGPRGKINSPCGDDGGAVLGRAVVEAPLIEKSQVGKGPPNGTNRPAIEDLLTLFTVALGEDLHNRHWLVDVDDKR